MREKKKSDEERKREKESEIEYILDRGHMSI